MTEKNKRRLAAELFLTFFKIGAVTFGGGYAMISLIEREIAEKKKYVSKKDILDIVAVAESTPGPIAINMATFVGFRTAGILGSAAATLGVVLPSFVIIFILSFIIRQFQSLDAVRYAFNGIRAGVLALIFKAWISMSKVCPRSVFSLIVAIAAFAVASFVDISVLWIVALSALCGFVYSTVRDRVTGARAGDDRPSGGDGKEGSAK